MGGIGVTITGEPIPTSPIITVSQPMAIGFAGPMARPGTSTTMSPTRQAIWLLMSTVGLPSNTEPTPSAPLTLTAGQACWSIIVRHAGKSPMMTFSLPGPGARGTDAWVVGSVVRAAGGTMTPRYIYYLSLVPLLPSSAVSGSVGASGVCGLALRPDPAEPPLLIKTMVP